MIISLWLLEHVHRHCRNPIYHARSIATCSVLKQLKGLKGPYCTSVYARSFNIMGGSIILPYSYVPF